MRLAMLEVEAIFCLLPSNGPSKAAQIPSSKPSTSILTPKLTPQKIELEVEKNSVAEENVDIVTKLTEMIFAVLNDKTMLKEGRHNQLKKVLKELSCLDNDCSNLRHIKEQCVYYYPASTHFQVLQYEVKLKSLKRWSRRVGIEINGSSMFKVIKRLKWLKKDLKLLNRSKFSDIKLKAATAYVDLIKAQLNLHGDPNNIHKQKMEKLAASNYNETQMLETNKRA
ncbi:hypothetical protein RIF29_14938 [Crotalaria pallida]|uniref:Uncharacterized protein n=1 Tax=Crotalaria pallida TaxID=3830 RepID=A0AAN9FEB4_CROPI